MTAQRTIAIALGLLLVPLPAHCAAGANPDRPNIIFILCDDLGYGDVGVFYQNHRAALNDRGIPFFRTPHIDSLAKNGAKLAQHYCAAPVCAPSRASLLSGLTQGHANIRDNQFDKALADSHTLGTVLKQAGYSTAAFGKWGLQGRGGKSPESWTAFPTKRGFDYYFGYVRHKDGHYHYPKEDGCEVWHNDHEVSEVLDKCYSADLWTAQAKKWITKQNADHPQQPFFVYLAYDTPHAKLQNPPCAYPTGGGLKGGVQWTGKPHTMLNTATGTVDGYMIPAYADATWDHDDNRATPEAPWPDVQRRYANDVRRIDFAVGDLLQLLKDLKIDDNTLVVFTSDNGPTNASYLKEHFAPTFFRGYGPFDGIKRDTWEGGVRTPTLVRWPGMIPAGRTVDQPSGQWDWMNTFAEIAGVPAPAASDGVSLLPSLTGRGVQIPSTVYIEYFNGGRTPGYKDFATAHRRRQRNQMQTILLEGYKGIRYDVKSAHDDFEIYNLTDDIREAHDLGSKPELAGIQTAMKSRVLQVRKPDPSAPRPYDSALVPPVKTTPGSPAGLAWSLFAGKWPWLPDFDGLTPVSQGKAQGIELSMAPENRPFGISFSGYYFAAESGKYTFTLDTDLGAMLFLHDIRVIDEPIQNPAGKHRGSIHLQTGWHPLRIYYRHDGTTDTPRLKLSCQHSERGTYELSPDVFQLPSSAQVR